MNTIASISNDVNVKKAVITNKNKILGFDKAMICAAIQRAGLEINQQTCEVAEDAVADAIIKYNPNNKKGKTLKSWVYTYIKWQIRRYLYSGKKQVNTVSLDEPIDKDKKTSRKSYLIDTISASTSIEGTILNNIMLEQLKQAISKMDKRGQFVVNFMLNATNPKRCGSDLGKALTKNGLVNCRTDNNRERARQLIQQYMQTMRDILANMGIHNTADIRD